MSNSGFTFRRVREEMIENLLEMGIKDFRVLDAMAQIPRHIFIDEALRSRAYENRSLTIGYQQTISQPYIVAKMTELLIAHTSGRGHIFKNILELGSGCGYQSAVLSYFSEEVNAIERIKPLVSKSRENLSELKIFNVVVKHGDGYQDWDNKKQYEGWELNFFDNAKNFRNYQWKLIKDKIKKKILEVGPGNCVFLERYYKISKEIFLFEPSESLSIKLSSKIENFKEVKLIKEYDNSNYDTIIYLDVVEHIEDDQNEILSAYNRLNKDGNLIINVPAFQFLYTDYDKKIGHYRRYSKSSFKRLLENLDINNFSMSYFDSIGFCLIFFSKYLAVSNKVNLQGGVKLWNFLIPISKILDIFLSPFIGKSLMVIIKKD